MCSNNAETSTMGPLLRKGEGYESSLVPASKFSTNELCASRKKDTPSKIILSASFDIVVPAIPLSDLVRRFT